MRFDGKRLCLANGVLIRDISGFCGVIHYYGSGENKNSNSSYYSRTGPWAKSGHCLVL